MTKSKDTTDEVEVGTTVEPTATTGNYAFTQLGVVVEASDLQEANTKV